VNSVTTFLTQDGGFWVLTLVKIALLLFIVLTVNAYLTWFERKVVALMQSRVGPHRVGPHGLLQPAADGLKFLFKEDVMPGGVDKFVYLLAPFLALTLALASLAVIPWGRILCPSNFLVTRSISGSPTPTSACSCSFPSQPSACTALR
jgi:NADH:ubiquinone oxidoreductase subunit H